MKKRLLIAVITFTSTVLASNPTEDAINPSHDKLKACVTKAGTDLNAQHDCLEAHAADMQDLIDSLVSHQLFVNLEAGTSSLSSAARSKFGGWAIRHPFGFGQPLCVGSACGPSTGGSLRAASMMERQFADQVTNMGDEAALQMDLNSLEPPTAEFHAKAQADVVATQAAITTKFANHSLEMAALGGAYSATVDHIAAGSPASTFRPELLSPIAESTLATNIVKPLKDEADRFYLCLQFPTKPLYPSDVYPFPANFDPSKVSRKSLYFACTSAHKKVLKQVEASSKGTAGQSQAVANADMIKAVREAERPQLEEILAVVNDPKLDLNPGGAGAVILEALGFLYSRIVSSELAIVPAGN